MHRFSMRNNAAIEEDCHSADAPKYFVLVENLFGNRLRITNQQSVGRPAGSVELGPADWGPSAFFADPPKDFSIGRIKIVGCLLLTICHKSDRVNTNIDADGTCGIRSIVFCAVACLRSGLSIEVNQRAEPARLTADDRNGQR